MTTKGEAIALGVAQMSTVELSSCDHGVVAKVKRCIMERDLYPRRWGLGPTALEKKKMKSDGKLDKYGRPNEATPSKWNAEYTDFNAPLENGLVKAPVKQAEPSAATGGDAMDTEVSETVIKDESQSQAVDDGDTKKRKRHEGESPEEKAERKRKKKEKKEKRKSKDTKIEADEDSD